MSNRPPRIEEIAEEEHPPPVPRLPADGPLLELANVFDDYHTDNASGNLSIPTLPSAGSVAELPRDEPMPYVGAAVSHERPPCVHPTLERDSTRVSQTYTESPDSRSTSIPHNSTTFNSAARIASHGVRVIPAKFSNDEYSGPADGEDFATTYLLNRRYELQAICDNATLPLVGDAHQLFVSCSEIAPLISLYQYIKLTHLKVIASLHGVLQGVTTRQLQRVLLQHSCGRYCPGREIVFQFKYLIRPRPHIRDPLYVDDLQDSHDGAAGPLRDLAQVDVLPVTLSNDVDVSVGDGHEYISTYLLNREFDFKSVVTSTNVSDIYAADVGMASIVCHTVDIATLVSLFGPLTIKHLTDLAVCHGLRLSRRRPDLLAVLLSHQCSQRCKGWDRPLHFKRHGKTRPGPFPTRTMATVEEAERERLQRAANRVARGVESVDIVADEAGDEEPGSKKRKFPYVCPPSSIREFATNWQEDMEPHKWIPAPCAVCARRTIRRLLSEENPRDFDLSLLRNPCLPVHTLPSTYNLAAYQGAILCPAALRDTQTLAGMDMCHSCKSVLARRKQPVDAIANFQYYARDELPAAVRNAFAEASMFDLMMVARTRATRITHMFSNKPGATKSMSNPATSQRYSKGNVAIFAQDVASVRQFLPPPRSEVAEAMCALFIGSETVPTPENIRKLGPVLVSKSRVEVLLDFLLNRNSFYVTSGAQYSAENMRDLFDPEWRDSDCGVPSGVELRCLPHASTMPTASYADRGNSHRDESDPSAGSGEVVMEAVGYTVGERTPEDYRKMKASAVAWCLDKNKFVQMQSSSRFLSDNDPGLLTFTFPNLDPWGIGGFNAVNRTPEQYIPFERQVRNLLLQHDGAFQNDPAFAYVCWNIIQKREVNKHITFRTNAAGQGATVSDIEEMAPHLSNMIKKWELNPRAKASNRSEKKALRTLARLRLIAKDLKGSSGYKQCRRNEIRAMMKKMSTPALFITLNPADIIDPLLGAMGGVTPEDWEKLTDFQRHRFVARNPGPAAIFFDEVIKNFIRIILRYNPSPSDDSPDGLFGRCSGYYATVEAQGRGTLHCHMLVWIEGNPSPEELRNRMRSEAGFKESMFKWLESIIKCQLPSDTEVVVEPDGPLKAPNLPDGVKDPRISKEPTVANMTDSEFERAFRETVEQLVIMSNWHDHKETCWKSLKNGEPRNDSTCRLGIDGSVNPLTHLDPETESIILKRLHPRINNYNELVIFILRCNMDIKYIGSGEAAKALVYYITDYITKGMLATNIGLSAVEYAIKQNDNKFKNGTSASPSTADINKSLFTKTVMSLMSKQEMSHQQVMSYLVGGGDFYASHKFKVVKWGQIDRYVTSKEAAPPDLPLEDVPSATPVVDAGSTTAEEADDSLDDDVSDYGGERADEEVTLIVNENFVGMGRNDFEYHLRSASEPFNSLSLWEHEEPVEKISAEREERRVERAEDAAAREVLNAQTEGRSVRKPSGRKAEARGILNHDPTHVTRMRSIPLVNVLLGDKIPRPDRSPEERTKWCRAMLILFKPWRTVEDLKLADQTWDDAFERTEFSPYTQRIMTNMHVENECKDARDTHAALRKAGRAKALLPGLDGNFTSNDIEDLTSALLNDAGLHDADSGYAEEREEAGLEVGELRRREKAARESETEIMQVLENTAIWKGRRAPIGIQDDAGASLTTELDRPKLAEHQERMKKLAADKRPLPDRAGDRAAKRRRLNGAGDAEPVTMLNQLTWIDHIIRQREAGIDTMTPEEILQRIARDRGIADNEEQMRALRIIAEHFMFGMEEQLMLYIAGVGGAGKSFIVKAVVEFFRVMGASEAMLLSAPTGCAAILIDGYTIHALTFLPKIKDERRGYRTAQLQGVWKRIKYLVIDEISMVSASLLAQISARINEGKAMDTLGTDNMFGAINVIFLGDMGQLRPVNATSLFGHEVVQHIGPRMRESSNGIDALYGAWIWRQVQKVVILRKNYRAATDPEYVNLLARVRLGMAWNGCSPMSNVQKGDGMNFRKGDYHTIRERQLAGLPVQEQKEFENAPVVCSTKVVRDLLNRELTRNYAYKNGKQIHDYHSRDHFNNCALDEQLQRCSWQVRSTDTKDRLGKVPLAIGMKVMMIENVALKASAVNGAEGIVRSIKYSCDAQGRRYADCAYVEIPDSDVGLHPDGANLVPIFPVKTYFSYVAPNGHIFKIARTQLPLLPAYAYVDYKSQGRSLPLVVVDLKNARSLQSLYVMLSRATSVGKIAVLRSFGPHTLNSRLGEEFRDEFARLEALDRATTEWYNRTRAERDDPELPQY